MDAMFSKYGFLMEIMFLIIRFNNYLDSTTEENSKMLVTDSSIKLE